MKLAFSTGALAAGFTAGALAGFVMWLVSVVTGAAAASEWAPAVVAGAGVLFAAATYAAEWLALRRTRARMRAHGEPWAYRER